MRLRRNVRKIAYRVIVLTALLWTLLISCPVYAASLEENCSVCFEMPVVFREKLKGQNISLRLYQVATVSEEGKFQGLQGYESLQLSELSYLSTAESFETKAALTAEFLGVSEWNEEAEDKADFCLEITDYSETISEIPPGLYLVCVLPIETRQGTYLALPYLVALPGMVEWSDETGKKVREWKPQMTVDIKLGFEENQEVIIPEEEILGTGIIDIPENDKEEIPTPQMGDDIEKTYFPIGLFLCGVVLVTASTRSITKKNR